MKEQRTWKKRGDKLADLMRERIRASSTFDHVKTRRSAILRITVGIQIGAKR